METAKTVRITIDVPEIIRRKVAEYAKANGLQIAPLYRRIFTLGCVGTLPDPEPEVSDDAA
jgi:hypothetical protein